MTQVTKLTTPGPCAKCGVDRWWRPPDLWGLLLCAACCPPPKDTPVIEGTP